MIYKYFHIDVMDFISKYIKKSNENIYLGSTKYSIEVLLCQTLKKLMKF